MSGHSNDALIRALRGTHLSCGFDPVNTNNHFTKPELAHDKTILILTAILVK